ncbi:MAG: alternative ribosome rescue aminoacyl-tRNA hydrolase ArfB [Candidatus Neomarinimicrobiota bacterium]
MIYITDSISISETEIREDFVRASGPGGQNVNKVATVVQLRFDVVKSQSLPEAVKDRLTKLAGKKMTDNGVLIIDSRQYRTQNRNREEALKRLVALIKKASERPKKRIKTKPTRAAVERRLHSKKHRSELKTLRKSVKVDD